MGNQRYLEGYAVVVPSRAEAYPLQGWYERRQTTTLQHPALEQGAGSPRPPRRAGGWVPRATAIGGSGRGVGVRGGQCLYTSVMSFNIVSIGGVDYIAS